MEPNQIPHGDKRLASHIQAAWEQVDEGELCSIAKAMVDTPSPTGEEAALAGVLRDLMADRGIESMVQPIDPDQANAVGRIRGDGSGPDLLLYAPIDTVLAGHPEEDLPWAGPSWREDFEPRARTQGPYVIGLGASNPKGHGACILGALAAIKRAGVPMKGDLIAGFGAGGMPTNARHSITTSSRPRYNTGQGVGCSFMLEQGVWADYAVIAKPGWSVAHEEVGLTWHRIDVHGTHTYVGSRHRLPYRNPVREAGLVVAGLEDFFERWAQDRELGLNMPQGIVGAARSGWVRMPSFTPATCQLFVDLRIGAETSPSEAKRAIDAALLEIKARHPQLEYEHELILSIPGSHTDQGSFIVRSAVKAWEAIEGKEHRPTYQTSGATDANILRNRGIPTARIGMPKVADAPFPVDFEMGMNTVDIREMTRLTRLLVYVAIDTAARSLEEAAYE